MNKINYVTGDATAPEGEGVKIIVHVCNDIGAWGAGFVMALSRKWEAPEREYRASSVHILGDVQLVAVDEDLHVANMIGQHGIRRDEDGFAPVRYSSIATGLRKVNLMAGAMKATLHCPRFGSDLAGGDWDVIERLIQECTSVPVTVYDLPIDKSIGIGRAIIQ
jgi:hypothetical protein